MATEENDRFIILNAQIWIAIHQLREALIKFHGCPSGARASLSFQILTAGLKSRPFKVPTCAELP